MSRNSLIVAGVLSAGFAAAANADTVYISYDGISGNVGATVSVSLSGGLHFGDGSSSKGLWAGQLSHTVDGVAAKTYCTEITQWAGSGVFGVVEVSDAPSSGPMGQAKAEALYRLFNATNGAADVDTNAEAAAFQAVIWEIVYDLDGGVNIGSGRVQISGVSGGIFDQYKNFANDPNGDKTPRIIAYISDKRQDQLGMRIVPLPGAAAMAGLGLAGVAARRRRMA